MADTKVTALTENTTPILTDIMYIVDDPGGSAASQKITLANLKTVVAGRVLINEASPSATTTVTWDSIPNVYRHLEIELMGRTDNAGSTVDNVYIYCNNDTTATNYMRQLHEDYDTTNTTAEADTPAHMQIAGNTAPANSAGSGRAFILDYTGTTFYKYIDAISCSRRATATIHMDRIVSEWESTVAITRIDLIATGNFISGSKARLYGVY